MGDRDGGASSRPNLSSGTAGKEPPPRAPSDGRIGPAGPRRTTGESARRFLRPSLTPIAASCRRGVARLLIATLALPKNDLRDIGEFGSRLLSDADRALYQAKQRGKNRVTHGDDSAESCWLLSARVLR